MVKKIQPMLWAGVILLAAVLSACTLADLFRPVPSATPTPPTIVPYASIPGIVLGDATAPITVEEYVDFQCLACGAFTLGTMQQIREKYVQPGKVKLVFYHYPFIGDESFRAAEASECANDQGKFWEYADLLFQNQAGENQGAFSDTQLASFARQLKLDVEQFKTCLADQRHLSAIQASLDDGNARGVYSVPTLFINGQMVRGVLSLESFEQHLAPYLK